MNAFISYKFCTKNLTLEWEWEWQWQWKQKKIFLIIYRNELLSI